MKRTRNHPFNVTLRPKRLGISFIYDILKEQHVTRHTRMTLTLNKEKHREEKKNKPKQKQKKK